MNVPRKLVNFALLFHEAANKGILLLVSAVLAMVIANSGLAPNYFGILSSNLTLKFHTFVLQLQVQHWINDLLMAIFFLLVGVEIKREFLEGHLSTRDQQILPLAGAAGGVLTPMLIYCIFNYYHGDKIQGWAIPTATDIAFTLGVLAFLGKNFPSSTRVFLAALAIIDDLAAILIIALFYTAGLSTYYLLGVVACILLLAVINRFNFSNLLIYMSIGIIMWFCCYRSGIHATISGVILGWFIPLKLNDSTHSPLRHLERNISPLVLYVILPLFAFANSGISFSTIRLGDIFDTVTLGIAFGLFIGKQVGVFTSVYILVKTGLAKLPHQTTFFQFYALSMLCGIGFTMSLFIGLLAFEEYPVYITETKLGVLLGSILSIIGSAIAIKIANTIKLKKEQLAEQQ